MTYFKNVLIVGFFVVLAASAIMGIAYVMSHGGPLVTVGIMLVLLTLILAAVKTDIDRWRK